MRLLKTDRFRRGIVAFDPDPQKSVPSGVEDQLYSRQVLKRIAARMSTLAPLHREALTLNMVHGYSAAESAAIANVKFETMRARLKKARRKMLKILKNDPMLVERLHLAGNKNVRHKL